MKLLYCPECDDLIKLPLSNMLGDETHYRCCFCGESWGRYIDVENAEYGGKAIPFGIDNNSFILAYDNKLMTVTGFFYPPWGVQGVSSEHIHFLEESQHGKRPALETLSFLRKQQGETD
jgi:hypothetical protein